MKFEEEANRFVELCLKQSVEILLVGGAAVNFYGYKRHSADIDFWINPTEENFNKLLTVFENLGYAIENLPEKVKQGKQNISIKISPEQEIEIITNFNPNKTFNEAYKEANEYKIGKANIKKMKVIHLNDLIASKSKSRRTKDMLDIVELKRLHKL
ncbi:MAG: nucleotidyltransferase [Vicingaceae bacterium]